MSPRTFKPSLAFLLIAVMVISLIPFDSAILDVAAQTSSSKRPRRGKNGLPSDGNKSRQNARSSVPASQLDARDRDDDDDTGDEADPQPAGQSESRSAPAARSGSTSQNRRTPPPFDRPPLPSSGGQSQASKRPSNTTGRPQSQPEARPPSVQTQRDRQADVPQQDVDPDETTEDRTGRRRPVLRRQEDSRQRGDQSRETSPPESGGVRGGGQNDQGTQPADGEAIKLDATLVNISLLVSDRSGRYIPQLSQRDFTLYEDGVQQEIAFFGDEEVPFNVVLCLDMSPSVAGYIDEIHAAATAFVRQLRSNDRVMIVSFDRGVNFLTDLTSNRRLLESAIYSTTTGSGTAVYDAVFLSVQRKLRNIEGRKALILFSDGEDTTSRQADYGTAIDSVTESDVLVYGLRYPSDGGNIRVNPWPRSPIPQIPIPFPWPWPRRRRGGNLTGTSLIEQSSSAALNWAANSQSRSRGGRYGDFMEDVATAGGGPVYDANQVGDISRLAQRIAEELRHVYVVSYYPTNSLSNGGYRAIRVRVKGRDDIAVRHRRGYNARDVAASPRT